MSFIRGTGKFIGKAAGLLIGGPIKYAGQKLDYKLVTEIGEGVRKASEFAGDTVGQAADGVWDTAAGLIDKDRRKRDQGLGEIGEAIGRTARGVYQTGKAVYGSGKDVYQGVRDGNDEQWKSGASQLVKVAAVATLAVGVVDFIDGADHAAAADTDPGASTAVDAGAEAPDAGDVIRLDTPNAELAGSTHPETGVPYETKVVEMPNGNAFEGVFPDFNERFAAQLHEGVYLESDDAHFDYSNQQLAHAVGTDPSLAAQFTPEQLEQIRTGETPDGYTWHHAEEPGRMELVESEVHHNSGHLGGRELWGGGEENR